MAKRHTISDISVRLMVQPDYFDHCFHPICWFGGQTLKLQGTLWQNNFYLTVTCPDQSQCAKDGPGRTVCKCEGNWHGYKCLRQVGVLNRIFSYVTCLVTDSWIHLECGFLRDKPCHQCQSRISGWIPDDSIPAGLCDRNGCFVSIVVGDLPKESSEAGMKSKNFFLKMVLEWQFSPILWQATVATKKAGATLLWCQR